MAKAILNISVDSDVLEYHRANTKNISKVVNDFLFALMRAESNFPLGDDVDLGKRLEQLSAEVAIVRAEKAKRDAVVAKRAAEAVELDLAGEVECLRGLRAEGKYFGEAFSEVCKKFGLQRSELVDLMDGKKAVGK